MKNLIITSALILLLLLTGCKTSKTAEQVSWEAFCQEYEYSYNTEDPEAINEYLDCWRGSAQEETILLNNGYEPF